MRLYCSVLFAAALGVAGAPNAFSKEIDRSRITCGEFLASGRDNMASMISWLRGYHAGKTGVIPYQAPDPYGGRLGFYCRQHPDASVIDASEQILSELDRGL
jgi:acid stress chaperone HdeB